MMRGDTAVAFVDCETSGLDPRRHEPWEVALIMPNGVTHEWLLPIDETRADLIALNIGGYFERAGVGELPVTAPATFAREFQTLTAGLHLCGNVVSFDANMIGALMLRHGVIPAWHYHLIDIESMIVGYLAAAGDGAYHDELTVPWSSEWLSRAIGVEPEQFAKHTALGDALWVRAQWEAMHS